MSSKISFDSLCVKEYQRNESTKPHQLPIYATSSFNFDSLDQGIDIFTGKETGHSYSRYGNPTIDAVAGKIAAMEAYGTDLDAYGYLTSSGMSAISTLLISTITPIFIDLRDKGLVAQMIDQHPEIKMIYLETPANPTLACIDIKWITDTAKEHQILTAIDNTFCTPINQRPLSLGIDFVIHSTTKYINGHGNSIAGIIVGHDQAYQKKIWKAHKLIGTNCNPWDAWLINNGMKTLALRMEKHSANAMTIARHIENHSAISQVNYCGLPSQGAINFINQLEFCSLAPTLGDVDTLVLHPATSSHLNVDKQMREANGVTDGLVRMSVGIENVEDIIGDIEKGLS